jgi:transcriptional regulator with XRE-family HTH domain
MKAQKIMINGEEIFLTCYVDRVVWGDEQVKRFAKLVAASGLSLRDIGEKASVAHSYIDKLRKQSGTAKLKELKQVLTALNIQIYQVFDAPTITIDVNPECDTLQKKCDS